MQFVNAFVKQNYIVPLAAARVLVFVFSLRLSTVSDWNLYLAKKRSPLTTAKALWNSRKNSG